MSQHPTGPRPQRHEIVDALDALASILTDALAPHVPLVGELLAGIVKGAAHTGGLRLLERFGVDTASVRVTAGHAPHLTVGAPHDVEDPGASPSTLRP